ncbi:septation protein SepH [Aldersonia sp. NBC_00410]|uniref:septation protein SepH n=1 Tax=Aldersonia sp. NBC_00410 TaxID=2975954 RepID=UPI00225917A3|nr:septation protein SepH [Aldersonia sp. NBC_00410]MCX5045696.1 septation protein SepH [Aldersonia sp. NBC_00410]
MRELRVIGLASDGKHIICADNQSGHKYRLPIDEKLRAASRGDIARFGQIEIEMESTLRPKDIQARIRSGASIEEVVAESGMPATRVERFAYPVLLERSRAAELAQKGHPVRANGPAVEPLSEIVAAVFRERGHDFEQAEWDAWKDEDGHWVAQLRWQAGRSVITAHWRFQLDAHGGTVTALDDPARDLIDPDFARPLRGLAAVTHVAEQDVLEPVIVEAEIEVHVEAHETVTVEAEHVPEPEPEPIPEPEPVEQPVAERPGKAAPNQAPTRNKKGKPAMPSWEDVLLGVRSSGTGR